MNSFKTIEKCQLCEGEVVDFWEMGDSPLANSYLKEKNSNPAKFPLTLCKCEKCHEVQLRHLVNPELLFSNYLYLTDYSPSLVAHFKQYAEHIFKKAGNKKPRVLEIGSNSGVLLEFFRELGADVVGVECAKNLVEISKSKGITTIDKFFSEEVAKEILLNFGPFDIIVANNVFAHVEDLPGIVRGCLSLLKDCSSLFVFENSYWLDIVREGYIDTVYHEHYMSHAVSPIKTLIQNCGGTLSDVSFNKMQGGSVRFYCRNFQNGYVSAHVGYAMLEEMLWGLNKISVYDDLKLKVQNKANALVEFVKKEKQEGRVIAVYGFPAKSTTLFDLIMPIADQIDYVFDDSKFKIGLYTPNGKKLIQSGDKIQNLDPSILTIITGAWNCFEDILFKNKPLIKEGVKFINPLSL